jgi:hypothetical protein
VIDYRGPPVMPRLAATLQAFSAVTGGNVAPPSFLALRYSRQGRRAAAAAICPSDSAIRSFATAMRDFEFAMLAFISVSRHWADFTGSWIAAHCAGSGGPPIPICCAGARSALATKAAAVKNAATVVAFRAEMFFVCIAINMRQPKYLRKM